MSEPLFEMTIDGKPVPQGRPKVSRSGRVYYGATCVAYRWEVTMLMRKMYEGEPLEGPVSVCLRFAGSRKGADLDNLAKLILDAMVDAKILKDDSAQIVSRLLLEYMPDEEPGVDIVVMDWP